MRRMTLGSFEHVHVFHVYSLSLSLMLRYIESHAVHAATAIAGLDRALELDRYQQLMDKECRC